MNHTRFEKYGAAVLSLMYRSMLRSSTIIKKTFHTHINVVLQKYTSKSAKILEISAVKNQPTVLYLYAVNGQKQFYSSFLFSKLDYCNTVLHGM